jgi:CelD/BcsL family acetyltransferase involved in cellulose biosynthesis
MSTLLKAVTMEGKQILTVTEYTDSSAFEALASQWDTLLEHCSTRSPFLTWQWQKLWWDCWKQNRRLRIITVGEENGRLCGIAPLYEEKKDGKRELMLLGSSDLCDYLDCIIAAGEEDGFYRTLLSYLVSTAEQPVTLTFNSLQHHSPAISFFKKAAHTNGYPINFHREDTAPGLDLPSDFELYLKMLSKKDRHEMRRKRRRAEQEQAVTFRTIVDPAQVKDTLPHFLTLFRKSAKTKNDFLTSERECFFRSLAEEFSRRGWLEIFSLSFDDREVAYLFCFHYNGTRYLYNAAYDLDYSNMSPGIVVTTYCLEDAISRGINRFDFLRGDETYKYRFGAQDHHLYSLTVNLLGEKNPCIA